MQALAAGDHTINGKVADPKRATKQQKWEPPKPKKVFVGGVPNDVEKEDLAKIFAQFGEVSTGILQIPKGRKKACSKKWKVCRLNTTSRCYC